MQRYLVPWLLVLLSSGCKDAGPQKDDDSILVEWTNRYGYNSDAITEGPWPLGSIESVTAFVTLDGQERAFPGTMQEDGRLKIAGVPRETPYEIEVRSLAPDASSDDWPHVSRYPIDTARHVRFGMDHWGRKAETQLSNDEDTKLALSITTPASFAYADRFSWIGLRSYFYRTADYLPAEEADALVLNAPEEDSTMSSDWTHPATLLSAPYGEEVGGLPVASADDDLLLLQTRQSTFTVDPLELPSEPWAEFSPWARFTLSEAVGVLDAKAVTFANGETNLVSGELVEPARKKMLVELDGESFNQIRAAGYPSDARLSASLQFFQEVGSGPQLYTSVAPMPWSISALSRPKPVNFECYPRNGECPEACCDSSTEGFIDPGTLSREFDIPRAYAEGMRDLFVLKYGAFLEWRHPESGEASRLYAGISEMRPAKGTQAVFSLKLAPVTGIRLNDSPLFWDADNTLEAATATVHFEPPALGKPEYYEVYVIELQPDAHLEGDDVERRPTRTVATLYTRETSVTIPENVLRSGRYYSLYVYATADGRDFSAPQITQREESLSTGVFSPVFRVDLPEPR